MLLLRALPVRAQAADAAELVLVGDARAGQALKQVLAELLQREGVQPTFAEASEFTPDALLAVPDGDRRVRVFITLPTSLLAKLYLRGPHGQRFLLRELSLRSGLDELGCESIAQVVSTSTQALLHTNVGMDREEVRAALPPAPPAEAQAVASPVIPKPPADAPQREPVRLRYELGARAFGGWTGAALHERIGGGVELALLQQRGPRPWLVRERLLFEQLAVQSLNTAELTADVRTSALRLGIDVGRVYSANLIWLGAAVGVDLVHIAPNRARDSSWQLAKTHVDTLAVVRVEARYERTWSALVFGMAALLDVALSDNRYQVRDGSTRRSVANPWRFTPALAISLGWRSK